MADDSKGSKAQEIAGRLSESVEALSAAALEKLTRPLLTLLRWTILAAVVVALAVLVFSATIIGLVRLFDSEVFPGRVWATDLLVAGIFVFAGALCWALSKKRKEGERV